MNIKELRIIEDEETKANLIYVVDEEKQEVTLFEIKFYDSMSSRTFFNAIKNKEYNNVKIS